MMPRRYFQTLAAALFVLALSTTNTFACACCAEPGTYSLQTLKPDSYRMDLIKGFRFAPEAKLYITEAGFDMVRGLDRVRKEEEEMTASISDGFDLAASFTGRGSWIFDLKTPKGTSGSLTLPKPAQMVSFAVDIHDSEDAGLGPLLYKEFRFKGTVAAASGFASSGKMRGTTYFLVFQGRGRGCDEVSDFKNWRLEIVGPQANYAFFGRLLGETVSE